MREESAVTHHRVSAETPRRLDAVLAEIAPRVSRRELRDVVASGAIRVNGRRARKGDVVRDGDVISLPAGLREAALAPDPTLPVALLWVDADLVAVDKPAGMPSLAQRSSDVATLGNFLVARFPETADIGDHLFECGATHRLDTDTSGVLLVARNRSAYDGVRRAFRQHRVEKLYRAIVRGELREPREVAAPLRAAGPRGGRSAVGSATRRAAISALTELWPEQRLRGATLLRVRIRTGARHQIRAHLAAIGHPVIGDRLYGGGEAERLLLHAAELELAHPRSGTPAHFEAPLPAAFREALTRLA